MKYHIPKHFKKRALWDMHDGLCRVEYKGQVGFTDATGRVSIPLRFHDASDFSEGRAKVFMDRAWGFIDKKGRVVIPLKFMSLLDYSEGLAAACLDGQRWGFINRAGKYVLPVRYQEVDSFTNGRAFACERDRWGVINKQGKWIKKPEYTGITWGGEDYIFVEKFGRIGYLNDRLELVGGRLFDAGTKWEDGAVKVLLKKIEYRLTADGVLHPLREVPPQRATRWNASRRGSGYSGR